MGDKKQTLEEWDKENPMPTAFDTAINFLDWLWRRTKVLNEIDDSDNDLNK